MLGAMWGMFYVPIKVILSRKIRLNIRASNTTKNGAPLLYCFKVEGRSYIEICCHAVNKLN